jgi:hypothetical protein
MKFFFLLKEALGITLIQNALKKNSIKQIFKFIICLLTPLFFTYLLINLAIILTNTFLFSLNINKYGSVLIPFAHKTFFIELVCLIIGIIYAITRIDDYE